MLGLTIKEAELVRGLCSKGRVSVSDSDLVKVASLLPKQMLKEAKKLTITPQDVSTAKDTIVNMGNRFLNFLGNKAPAQISTKAYNAARDKGIQEAEANQGWFRRLFKMGPDAKSQKVIEHTSRKFGLSPAEFQQKARAYGDLYKKWKTVGTLSQDEMTSLRNLGRDLQITKANNISYKAPSTQDLNNLNNVLNYAGDNAVTIEGLTKKLNDTGINYKNTRGELHKLQKKYDTDIQARDTIIGQKDQDFQNMVKQKDEAYQKMVTDKDKYFQEQMAARDASEKDKKLQELLSRRWYQDPATAAAVGVGGTLAGIGGLNAAGNMAGAVFGGNRGYDDRRGRGPVIIS